MNRSRRPGLVALPLLLLSASAALAAPATAAPAPRASAPGAAATEVPRSLELPEGALVAPGKAADLELLYTGDVIGYLEDCGCKLNPAGGLARRAWLLNQIKTNYPGTPVVLLDGGNFSDNPTEKGDIRTKALIEQMAKLGYKAVSVGERDLTLGYDDLQKRIEGSPMTFLSTNIVTQGTKTPVYPPYAIVETKDKNGEPIRIGVLGVIRYTPVWQKAGPNGSNLAVAPPVEMVKKYVAEVRGKSDVVVLLAALAKDDAQEIAKQVPELDLLVGSYGGIYSTVDEKVGNVRIVYTGNQGKRIGESRITLDAKRHPADVVTFMHFLTSRYPSDPAMADLVAAIDPKPQAQAPNAPKKLEPAPPAPGEH